MSCTNPNCNPGCGCNGCCPPVPPPVPPTPPICIGENCVEHYDGNCVIYTGPDILCIGVETNNNINTIIQALATRICNCCGEFKCISPFKLFFERFKATYDLLYAADPTVDFYTYFSSYVQLGVVVKKCQYCCPDVYMYALAIDPIIRDLIIAEYNVFAITVEIPGQNVWADFQTCATSLLTEFDTTLDGSIAALTLNEIYEFGGINDLSGICNLNDILTANFTEAQITSIMTVIYEDGLSLACDLAKGNIMIGSVNAVSIGLNI